MSTCTRGWDDMSPSKYIHDGVGFHTQVVYLKICWWIALDIKCGMKVLSLLGCNKGQVKGEESTTLKALAYHKRRPTNIIALWWLMAIVNNASIYIAFEVHMFKWSFFLQLAHLSLNVKHMINT